MLTDDEMQFVGMDGTRDKLLQDTAHLPRVVQQYWLGLAAAAGPLPASKHSDLPQALLHFRLQRIGHAALGGRVGAGAAASAGADAMDAWDTAQYMQDLKTARAQVKTLVSPKVSKLAVDHAARVLVAVNSLVPVCELVGLSRVAPRVLTADQAYGAGDVNSDKSVRCYAMQFQVQTLRPVLRALQQEGGLRRKYPVLWEALEEFLAAALGTPLNSSLDLVRGDLGAPEDIIKSAVVGTAVLAHMQCFAGGPEVLVPKAAGDYTKSLAHAPPAVQDRIASALQISSTKMATAALGVPSTLRDVLVHACNAVGALMKHEVYTLASGAHASCPL